MRITTHVLDGTYGRSAVGVGASLERASGNGWITVCNVETDRTGRIDDWGSWPLERGLYRVVFDSDSYFAVLGAATAYPEVIVIFRMQDDSRAFEVQITLSPYSYSAYFGTTEIQPENSG